MELVSYYSVSLALGRSEEPRNVAVFWGEPLVHDENGHWADGQEDPEGVYQVDLDPEGDDNDKNQKVVEHEDRTPEG